MIENVNFLSIRDCLLDEFHDFWIVFVLDHRVIEELLLLTNVRHELETVVIEIGSFLHGGGTGIIDSDRMFFHFDVCLRFS